MKSTYSQLQGQVHLELNKEARDLTKAKTMDNIWVAPCGIEMVVTLVVNLSIDIGIAKRKMNLMIFVPRKSKQNESLLMELYFLKLEPMDVALTKFQKAKAR